MAQKPPLATGGPWQKLPWNRLWHCDIEMRILYSLKMDILRRISIKRRLNNSGAQIQSSRHMFCRLIGHFMVSLPIEVPGSSAPDLLTLNSRWQWDHTAAARLYQMQFNQPLQHEHNGIKLMEQCKNRLLACFKTYPKFTEAAVIPLSHYISVNYQETLFLVLAFVKMYVLCPAQEV